MGWSHPGGPDRTVAPGASALCGLRAAPSSRPRWVVVLGAAGVPSLRRLRVDTPQAVLAGLSCRAAMRPCLLSCSGHETQPRWGCSLDTQRCGDRRTAGRQVEGERSMRRQRVLMVAGIAVATVLAAAGTTVASGSTEPVAKRTADRVPPVGGSVTPPRKPSGARVPTCGSEPSAVPAPGTGRPPSGHPRSSRRARSRRSPAASPTPVKRLPACGSRARST